MKIHKDSHTDHVSKKVLEFIKNKFQHRTEFFIETVELPEVLGELDCALYGPAMGDEPIPEAMVRYEKRDGRQTLSRMIDRPSRSTRLLTVIGGPHKDEYCVLYTAFGGPQSPREPGDPDLIKPEDIIMSRNFWEEHALAALPSES